MNFKEHFKETEEINEKINDKDAKILAKKLDSAIESIDPEMGVDTFAKAVAIVLKESYGSHNYEKFIGALKSSL